MSTRKGRQRRSELLDNSHVETPTSKKRKEKDEKNEKNERKEKKQPETHVDIDPDVQGEEEEINIDLDVELSREEDGGIHLGELYIPPPPPPALTFDNDRPRLVITHIENENFKSYAGKRVLGPFHKSFTAIVGPNGSGKSNVIDSMLFVFGYRAQKIRSKNTSVLIHNSSEHPDVRSCTVRVFFQEIIDNDESNPSGIPVEGTQFCVARTASKGKDVQSHYEINGKKCTFRDVRQLLLKKGVDLEHNRFLILQGEVEQIALMKPKAANPNETGMLEFLEDIVGSSRFQKPIDLLQSTVAQLDELRNEKLARVKLVAKEKAELEGPRNEAIEYLKMENKMTEKKNELYQYYIYSCSNKMEEIGKKKDEYEEGAASIISKVEEIVKKRTDTENELKSSYKNMEEIGSKLEKAEEDFKKHEIEDAKMREEMKLMNQKRKKTALQAKNEKEKYERFLNVPEMNESKIKECETQKEKLEAICEEEQTKYDKALKDVNDATKELQDQREKLQTQLMGLKKDVNEKESSLRYAENQLNLVNSKEQKEKSRLDDLIMAKENGENKLKHSKEREKELEKIIPAKEKQCASLKEELNALIKEDESLFLKIKDLQATTEEKKANFTASRSKGRVIEALMEQKRIGKIPGIFGRLGDLGAIDKKYDVAISTATGNSLDTILVDSVETAKHCIEFLRRNNIGRANFLALEKTKRLENHMNAQSRFPEGVPRLFDLVTPKDPKFSTAFYHYMRETLVTDELEQGKRIAYGAKRYRVVTLDGDVIETSGAMSGGGKERMRGKMGTEIIKDDGDDKNIKLLEEELMNYRRKHDVCVQKKSEHEIGYNKLSKELEALNKELKRLKLDLKHQNDRFADFDSQIKKQEKALAAAKPNPEEQKSLEAKIEELTKLYDESKENAGTIDFDVKKLNGKINDIRSSKLKGISKKLDETKTQLDKVKKEITRLNVEIKSAQRDVEKSKEKLEAYESEVKEAEEKLISMKKHRESLESKGTAAIEELQELKKQQNDEQTKAEETQEILEKVKKAEAKMRSQQIEINETREKFVAELKEQEKHQNHWKREIKKLRLREIPVEELSELKTHDEEHLKTVEESTLNKDIEAIEEKLKSTKINQAVIEEYKIKENIYLERVGELDVITQRKDKQRKNHEELRKQRLNEFMKGFSTISSKLKEMYQMITLGGDAELELVDSLDPFTEGIIFSVRPPNKSWKNISNLSGGEKTLSSLALVFALHFYKPTPLYVMDEIDAALDFKNVSIVANYIKERTKNAQFVIISLRSNMFELADRLVGIYKTYNCTKSVTINPSTFETKTTPAVEC